MVWKPVVDFTRQLLAIIRKQAEHEKDIKALQQDGREVRLEINQLRQDFTALSRAVERLAYEIQGHQNNERHEREKLLLRLELLLRSERGLPPASPSDSEKDAEIEALKQQNEALQKRLDQLERRRKP